VRLAQHFAARYDPSRGYGPAMHGVLARIRFGEPWQAVAPGLFARQGSFGMARPCASRPSARIVLTTWTPQQATRSAEVTHAHPEAGAGAIAVAVAAAWAWQLRDQTAPPRPSDFLDLVLALAESQGQVVPALPRLPLGALKGSHGILPLACLPAEGRLKKNVSPNVSKPRSKEDRARRVRHALVMWVGEAVAGRECTDRLCGS
jgi:hypothetical protein